MHWQESWSCDRWDPNSPGSGEEKSFYWEERYSTLQDQSWADPDGKKSKYGTLKIRDGKKPLWCVLHNLHRVVVELFIWLEFALDSVDTSIENWNEC